MAIQDPLPILLTLVALPAAALAMSVSAIRAETSDRSRVVAQAEASGERRAAQVADSAAKTESKTAKPAPAADRPKRTPRLAPAREAAALAFVKANHPELSELLASLRVDQPEEYDKAVRDLFRISERLAQSQESDPSRYELELKLWKAQSQIELLIAQLRMSDSPPLRVELRQTLRERLGIQKMLFEHERSRVAERYERLSQNIERLETQQDQMVDRQMDALLRSARAKPKRDE